MSPPKFRSTRNLGMWPYLERGLCRSACCDEVALERSGPCARWLAPLREQGDSVMQTQSRGGEKAPWPRRLQLAQCRHRSGAPGVTGSWLGRGGPLPGASGGSTALPAPRRCRSGLPSSERINSSSVSRQLRGTSAPTVRRAPRPRGSSRPSAPTWSSLRASDAVLGAARGPTDPAPRFPGQRVSAPWQAG